VRGKTLVLTTSSGTRCVEAAQEGRVAAVLTGALPNATALSQAAFDLAGQQGRDVSLIAAGFDDQATVEDLFAARLIARRLAAMGAVLAEGEWDDHLAESEAAEILKNSPSGQKLKGLGYGEDVAFCAQIDVLNVVPIYRGDGFVV
jgi:2-phosphosulfolactate phosphatase